MDYKAKECAVCGSDKIKLISHKNDGENIFYTYRIEFLSFHRFRNVFGGDSRRFYLSAYARMSHELIGKRKYFQIAFYVVFRKIFSSVLAHSDTVTIACYRKGYFAAGYTEGKVGGTQPKNFADFGALKTFAEQYDFCYATSLCPGYFADLRGCVRTECPGKERLYFGYKF